ncbi:hypothetical protein K1719_021581 [Acacia pycnantha]|nr:hypothetical protein K1719_021581 [Acacia pycnantha]
MGKFQNPQGNPYSQTYNSAWRTHPNFSWSQGNSLNQAHGSTSGTKPIPPGFQMQSRQLPIKEEESKTDKMLARILSEVESSRVETKATFSLHETAIKNLEVQMGQLASQVNVMSRSNLPSDTIPNPKRVGKEECNAINLRSGKVLPDVPSSSTPQPKQDDQVIDDVEEESVGRKMKLTRESNLKKV